MVTIRLPVTEGNTQWSSKAYCQSKTSWALSIIFLMDPVNYSPLGPRYSSSSWTFSIILLLDLVIHLPHGLCQSSSSWTLSIIFLIDLVNHPPHRPCQSSSSWSLSIIFLMDLVNHLPREIRGMDKMFALVSIMTFRQAIIRMRFYKNDSATLGTLGDVCAIPRSVLWRELEFLYASNLIIWTTRSDNILTALENIQRQTMFRE